MSTSLIRSRAMVTHAIDRHRWNEITDGAVLQDTGLDRPGYGEEKRLQSQRRNRHRSEHAGGESAVGGAV
jgi:hypothetical protein